MNTFSLEGNSPSSRAAGRGIGAAVARGFAEAGAAVAVTARTATEIDAVVDGIRTAGGQGVPHVCDVSDASQLPVLVEPTVYSLGALDILVQRGWRNFARVRGHRNR